MSDTQSSHIQPPIEEDDQDTEQSEDSVVDQTADPRHTRRINLMQQVFSYSFHEHADQERKEHFVQQHPEISELIPAFPEIDEHIHQLAPERPVNDINKVDLAILRTIMFEWREAKTPKKVLIDEAIELAKEFGTESSPRFINGVLGKLFA